MAVTHKPVFAQAQRTATAVATAAKSTYADAANAVLLLTAGPDGALVTRLQAMPRGTVTATQLQVYVSRDGGTTLDLVESRLLGAYTMAATSAIPMVDFGFVDEAPLRLGPSDRLYVALGVEQAPGVVFFAAYADF